jgi:hypothetical protein
MKALLAAAMIATMATAAFAQDAGTGSQRHAHMHAHNGADQKKKTDEATTGGTEIRSDLPFDPWRNMRSVETPKGDKTPN